ncbi:MAG: hypothetical protein ACRDKJ_10510 [Actinomycetota bacterium]
MLKRLRPFLLERRESQRWPGTELLEETATVYRFDANEQMVDLMSELAVPLFDWCQPTLPEDLSLLRDDETEWLVSITHERDAYLKLTLEEHEVIVAEYPQLADLLVLNKSAGADAHDL